MNIKHNLIQTLVEETGLSESRVRFLLNQIFEGDESNPLILIKLIKLLQVADKTVNYRAIVEQEDYDTMIVCIIDDIGDIDVEPSEIDPVTDIDPEFFERIMDSSDNESSYSPDYDEYIQPSPAQRRTLEHERRLIQQQVEDALFRLSTPNNVSNQRENWEQYATLRQRLIEIDARLAGLR